MIPIGETSAAPAIADRETWIDQRMALLDREKAHTREGDAIAAARRRLPMTEVPNVAVAGEHGLVLLLDLWEDSPAGWPQERTFTGWRRDGRPVAQWSRPGATPVDASAHHH